MKSCSSLQNKIKSRSVLIFVTLFNIAHDLELELKLLHFDYQL